MYGTHVTVRGAMGLTHIRTPKNFVLEERLERHADAIETNPERYRGRWAEACWPLGLDDTQAAQAPAECQTHSDVPGLHAHGLHRYENVYLDLGCGKGSFLVASAERDPHSLYIGMDTEPICVAYAAQRICEARCPNALILPRCAESLARIFAPGELAGITLNFPTPFPKRRHAEKRLTNVDHLMSYRPLLAPGGTVTLRTDSKPLRDYSLTQFTGAGYEIAWVSDDVRAEHASFPETEYEQRLAARGAQVYGICALPRVGEMNPVLVSEARDAEQSLVAYLPDDLEHLGYVPLGMEGAVVNLRNRRRRARAR